MSGSFCIANRAIRSVAKQFHRVLFDLGDSRNRKVLWDYLSKKRALADATACLKVLLPPDVPVTEEIVQHHLDELTHCDSLWESVEKHRAIESSIVQLPNRSEPTSARNLFCYVATRLLKPTTVVETGCATGWMSALLLFALRQNQKGHLYSIDLPPVAGRFSMEWTMPEGLAAGFLVPAEFRNRWTLIQGDVRLELVPLLEKLQSVDLFCHDSDHSYVHMMWEYTSVWPYLSKGGVLVSDDIGWNTAFWDFATAAGRPIVVHKNDINFGTLSRS